MRHSGMPASPQVAFPQQMPLIERWGLVIVTMCGAQCRCRCTRMCLLMRGS